MLSRKKLIERPLLACSAQSTRRLFPVSEGFGGMAAEEKGAAGMALDEKPKADDATPAVRFEIRKWNAVCM